MHKLALRHPTTVVTLMIMLLVAGFYSYATLPRESSPDINLPYVIVSVPYFGVAPADIETLVIVPLEKRLKELKNVKEMKSTSAESVGIVMLEFESDVEIEDALTKVRTKVDMAKPDMPAEIEEPTIDEINFAEFPIITINLAAEYDPMALKSVADDLKDKLEGIQGVLAVDMAGGLEREIQIDVDPDRLRYLEVSLDSLIGLVHRENVDLPGGHIEIDEMKYGVRVDGEFQKVDQIPNMVVSVHDGNPIYVRDVAEVIDGIKEPDTISRLNGRPTISLKVKKRIGANIIEVTDKVKVVVEEDTVNWPDGTGYTITNDGSVDIRNMLADLENNILSGLILVVTVLFLFLGLRNSFFVAVAIPFSMLLSLAILDLMGITLNMVVLFSLILSLGMLVDNAIVIVENIYRHYSEGKSRFQAAVDGTGEVAWPIFSSTMTTNGAFFPMLFWPGIMGDFMWYLPVTVIVVLSSSLFVALVINPVICSTFLTRKSVQSGLSETSLEGYPAFMKNYGRFLDLALRHRIISLAFPFLLLPVSIMLYGAFGQEPEFFPQIDPRRANVNVRAADGTAIEFTDALTRGIEGTISPIEDVRYVLANVGVAAGSGSQIAAGSGSANSNQSVTTMEFIDFTERQRSSLDIIEEVREKLSRIPGAEITIAKEEEGPPTGAPVNIEIHGEDYKMLKEISREIQATISDIPNLVDLKDDFVEGKPEIRIEIDREKAALLDLNTHAISMLVRNAVHGNEAGKFRREDEEYDIVVRLKEEDRSRYSDILNLPLADKDGMPIPLSTVADVHKTGGYGTLRRIDQKRTVTVSSDVTHEKYANVVLNEVKKRLADHPLPPGYGLEYTGQNQEQNESQAFLTRAFVITLFIIGFILVTQFNSWLIPGLIVNSVVLSLIGVFLSLLALGNPFNIIMTGIGVISLAGVVVNNAIVFIDFILKTRARGIEKAHAIRHAGVVRLRPVLLTAVTTILGLVPMATGVNVDFSGFLSRIFDSEKSLEGFKLISAASESAQWWGPMAQAVIFGLAFATLLTLIVLPVSYSLLDGILDWVKSRIGLTLVREDENGEES